MLHIHHFLNSSHFPSNFVRFPLKNQLFNKILHFQPSIEGGATIFPQLGLAVSGQPGQAVLFYNTLLNGEPDPKVAHAGCPVWAGEKFIGTFWFRQFYQEFLTPCPRKSNQTGTSCHKFSI